MIKDKLILGSGSPRVAVIAALHGDEPIGLKVLEALRKERIKKGTLGLFVGHPLAVKRKKRFITHDLNRVFPGKSSGSIEEKTAYALIKKLKPFDVVIDIHGTNSDIDSLIIITKQNKAIKKLLSYIPVKKVAFIPKKVFGGKEMITHCQVGISLEYGPDKSTKRYKTALRDVKAILKSLKVISGGKKRFEGKKSYTVHGSYPVPHEFIQEKSLKDFHLIRKGQKIGSVRGKSTFSNKTFYPLFLGKGRYPKLLALIAQKSNL